MRTRAGLSSGLLACALACSGGTDSTTVAGSESDSEAHETEHASEHTSEHTTEHGTTSTDTEGGTEHTHETDHTTTAGGSDGTSDGDTRGATTGGIDSSPAGYCYCMLEFCHDEYHATWGEDHVESEQMCIAEASALPSVGMDVDAGNSLECRLHYCLDAMAVGDPSVCASAIGMDACQ